MFTALTRRVPPSIVRCELTHLSREPIDVARAVEQHEAYERMLEALGGRVEHLPDLPDRPDSVFVEDAAVVVDEIAIVTRPGAESRREEVPSVAAALLRHREVVSIEAPGTVDGGDVLVAGRRVYVGVSGRTNEEGARQLAALLAPHRYTVTAVPVRGCLHLKSAVTLAAPGTFVLNPAWVDRAVFDGFNLVEVDPAEPMGANVLRVGEATICAAAHPRTRRRIGARGIQTVAVDAGEVAKAEGALTCCSIIVAQRGVTG